MEQMWCKQWVEWRECIAKAEISVSLFYHLNRRSHCHHPRAALRRRPDGPWLMDHGQRPLAGSVRKRVTFEMGIGADVVAADSDFQLPARVLTLPNVFVKSCLQVTNNSSSNSLLSSSNRKAK